jgi:hypothetical protein
MREIHRFSSRRQRLDHSFLANRLKGAKSYKRIAGYFRSSIFELVGEEIADIPRVQIVCNSELDAADVVVSKHVRETALKERWNEALAEVEALLHKDRYRRLHSLLTSGRVEIRVVPKDRVFVHGKAGVIEAADGSKTCFLGSINETRSAFAHNYEILWEDTSPEGVMWVEEEFEALWQEAFPLPDAVIEEIKRITDRVELLFEEVTSADLPAAALVESPIYRGGEQLQPCTKNLLLGTVTPIQTEVSELWDLMRILNAGADFVLGRAMLSHWADWHKALPVVKGVEMPVDEHDAWEWLRNPLPPGDEEPTFASLRLQLGIPDNVFFTDRGFGSLGFFEQQTFLHTLEPGYYREHNPIVRHTVLRHRRTLEDAGLLDKVAVDIHPHPQQPAHAYAGVGFAGLGLLTNLPFDLAYQAAEGFTAALQHRTRSAGFMKTLLFQRICSSFASGKATAETLLRGEVLEDEDEMPLLVEPLSALTPTEAGHLGTIIEELSRPEARDPKLAAVTYFLTAHRTEGKTWLEHGCIIFSQYYDTAQWIAAELTKVLPNEPVAVYAGTGKSIIFRGNACASVDREDIKQAVKHRNIRLVVATDAACEGLNLQTLGTLINVDLPWNPSRLEQRLGRIKRFGQARRTVDMLNLVYHDTQDEKVYQVLSRRLKDKFDIFGGLPDTIEDDWIESVEKLEAMMDQYIHLRQRGRDVFDLRYKETIDPDKNRWELCSRVLARKDVVEKLSESW